MRSRLALALALAACSPTPPPAPPPAPQPSAAPAASAAPSEAPAPVVSLFAYGWALQVAPTRGAVLVHDGMLTDLLEVRGNRVTAVPDPWRGLPVGAAHAIRTGPVGGWPEGAFIAVRRWDDVGGGDYSYHRHTQGGWEPIVPALDKGESLHWKFVAGAQGGALVLTFPGQGRLGRILAYGGGGAGFLPVAVSSLSFPERLAALPSGEMAVIGRVSMYEWAVERFRPGESTSWAIVPVPVLPPGGDTWEGNVYMCLAPDGALHTVRSSRRTKTILATLRGRTWETQEVEGAPQINLFGSCTAAKDGTVYFPTDNGRKIFRRAPDGRIAELVLPEIRLPPSPFRVARRKGDGWTVELRRDERADAEPQPSQFIADDLFVAGDDGSMWIPGRLSGSTEVERGIEDLWLGRQGLLRVGPPIAGTPIDWEQRTAPALTARLASYSALRGPRFRSDVPLERCPTVFVRLLTFGKATPEGHDFPLVRAVVKGRADLAGSRFVEARVQNREDPHPVRVLGALVPSLDVGKHLVALLKGKVSSAGAGFSCGRPAVLRVISMGVAGE